MYLIQQLTLFCMAVIVFVSPLINIYFIVKNANNKKIAGFLGIGLYIVFVILLLITFLVDT